MQAEAEIGGSNSDQDGKQRQRRLIYQASLGNQHKLIYLRLLLQSLNGTMDDDLTFGASVWGQPEPVITSPIPSRAAPAVVDEFEATAFNDFDDFGEPEGVALDGTKEDDDFGDFGDFGEADPSSAAFGDSVTFDEANIPGPSSRSWRPLLLDPFPSRPSLEAELEDTLGPIWHYEDITAVTTDEPIREAEGVAQILTTPSRYVRVDYGHDYVPNTLEAARCINRFRIHCLLRNLQTGHAPGSVVNTSSHLVSQ